MLKISHYSQILKHISCLVVDQELITGKVTHQSPSPELNTWKRENRDTDQILWLVTVCRVDPFTVSDWFLLLFMWSISLRGDQAACRNVSIHEWNCNVLFVGIIRLDSKQRRFCDFGQRIEQCTRSVVGEHCLVDERSDPLIKGGWPWAIPCSELTCEGNLF